MAQALMVFKHPSKKEQIKAVCNFVLKQFEKFQKEENWLFELEEDIQNNLFAPKLLRRHSI
jgi:hypothetical protein